MPNDIKQARREKMEGKSAPGNVKKSNATTPGAPGTGVRVTNQTKMNMAANMAIGGKQMNSPDPAMQAMVSQTAHDFNGGAPNPYNDALIQSPAMTTVMPQPVSGMQSFAPGLGLNANGVIGMQQQPIEFADQMLSQQANIGNKYTPSAMGMIGMAATPAPGGTIPRIQQTPGTQPLEGVSSADYAGGGVNMKTGKRGK